MRIFKDLEFVERLGSGIPYIVSKYGKEIFKLMSSVIRFSYSYDEVVTTPKTISKTISKTNPKTISKTNLKLTQNYTKVDSKILHYIQQNQSITMGELSEELKMTKEGVRWNFRNLQKRGIIHRVGSNRWGYWEVIK